MWVDQTENIIARQLLGLEQDGDEQFAESQASESSQVGEGLDMGGGVAHAPFTNIVLAGMLV